MKKAIILCLSFFIISIKFLYAQIGKDGALTISTSNVIVNEYTILSLDAISGSNSITVANSGLNTNGRFSASLSAGDLIMIIQMQGASIDATPSGPFSAPNSSAWGAILNYNNCGNYEFLEVATVPNATTITFTCNLSHSYTASGKTQIVRVPRYTTLTINGGASLTGEAWNGSTGGVVAIEAQNTLTINGNITASDIGFRGAVILDNVPQFGAGFYASNNNNEGAPKGEGIAGHIAEYTAVGGQYCRGAAANGGGGGNGNNAGGGGGGNAGDITNWNGQGNPDVSNAGWITCWNMESPGFSANTSSGGGRGGYTHSNNNQNAATTAPGNASWGGDNRRPVGGLGGRPLDYSTGKIFMGGGGGAGEQDNSDAGNGGNGGGIVYIISHGTVGGTGTINANGQNGQNSNNASPPAFGYAGVDGAGGAGAGGTVIINASGTISGITINANGGNGGNNNIALGFGASPTNQAYGPGGGGGGGYIAISNGTITRNANGGNNGTTNSSGLTEFPPNGATRGGAGINNASISNYFITTTSPVNVCYNNSTTLTANVTGTLPAGSTIYWFDSQFGNNVLATGTTYNTPPLTANTTVYVGVCPGFYRLPVDIIVSPQIQINPTNMVITDESCAGNDGSIIGITVSGGSGTLSYSWNGNPTPSPNITNISAGSYTLTVTDANGCMETYGPVNVSSSGGPVINTANINITHASCGNNNGAITGITASGGVGTLTYDWGSGPQANADITNIAGGSYTLTVTDQNNCSTSAGPFTVNTTSAVNINNTNVVVTDATCGNNNGSITGITVSGGDGNYSYQWNGSPAAGADLTNVSSGSYTLVVTDGNGCSASSGPYTINSAGNVSINITNMIITHTTCGHSNGAINGITLSGGLAPYNIEWNGIPSNPDINNLPAGNYTIQVTDANGCVNSAGPFTINPSSGLNLSTSQTNVSCFGYNDGIASVNVSGGTPGYTYLWTPGGQTTPAISGLAAGTYMVTVNDAAGCDSSISVTISEPAEIISTLSGNTNICSGNSTVLTVTGGGTYLWSTSQTGSSITVNPTATTTYTVEITVGSCTKTDSITVNVSNPPVASVSGDTVICLGETTTLIAAGGTGYLWNDGQTTASINVNPVSNTQYTVAVNNICGSDVAIVNVIVNPLPLANAGSNQTVLIGNSTTLNGSGGITYSWSPSNTLSCSTCQNPVATPLSTTTYTVTVTDANGCTDTARVTIFVDEEFVLFVPDAFSPNGDGNNDLLFVRGGGIESFIFKVYDRWGQNVFTSTNLNEGWDGTFKGKALDMGVFAYTLEGKYYSGTKFNIKGNVTLVR
jgi:gliding motility-associated-like protein